MTKKEYIDYHHKKATYVRGEVVDCWVGFCDSFPGANVQEYTLKRAKQVMREVIEELVDSYAEHEGVSWKDLDSHLRKIFSHLFKGGHEKEDHAIKKKKAIAKIA